MKFKYINFPEFVSPDLYHSAISRMITKLSNEPSVMSIFQIGGISTPGISDIDLYVVFKDDKQYHRNPVQNISPADRYLFTHNLFGTSKSLALKMEQFTFFGKYEWLHGEKISLTDYEMNEADRKLLQYQIAIEYLIKALISISSQIELRTIKIRGLFLHSKALMYDLKFLGVTSGSFYDCLSEIIDIRKGWFNKTPNTLNLDYLVSRYQSGLEETISSAIKQHNFYLAPGSNLRIGKNIRLIPSAKIEWLHSGFKIPYILRNGIPLLQKLNNKTSNYALRLPVVTREVPEIIVARHNVIAQGIEYNKKYLNGFLCTAYGMNIFRN